jgi:hypothetical protein
MCPGSTRSGTGVGDVLLVFLLACALASLSHEKTACPSASPDTMVAMAGKVGLAQHGIFACNSRDISTSRIAILLLHIRLSVRSVYAHMGPLIYH